MKKTFKPLHDMLLVEPIRPTVKPGGIIVASDEYLKPTKGKVLAVGSGTFDAKKGTLKPIPVQVGEEVMWAKGAMQEHKVGDEKLCLVPASQLIGVVRE